MECFLILRAAARTQCWTSLDDPMGVRCQALGTTYKTQGTWDLYHVGRFAVRPRPGDSKALSTCSSTAVFAKCGHRWTAPDLSHY